MTENGRYAALHPEDVRAHLPQARRGIDLWCPEEVDSTNTRLKEAALRGAAAGTAIIAHRQTAGRGRQGRSFLSPEGKGLYLSVLLRPKCPAEQLMRVTGMAAVAVCRAVEGVCGARCGIGLHISFYICPRHRLFLPPYCTTLQFPVTATCC